MHSNELFPNKTSFTSNEQNISKGKAKKKKKTSMFKKKKELQQYLTSKEYLSFEVEKWKLPVVFMPHEKKRGREGNAISL